MLDLVGCGKKRGAKIGVGKAEGEQSSWSGNARASLLGPEGKEGFHENGDTLLGWLYLTVVV